MALIYTEVEKLLRGHLEAKARAGSIKIQIKCLRRQLKTQSSSFVESEAEKIAGMSLKAAVINDMPGGGQSAYQSCTERVALTHSFDGRLEVSPEDIKNILKKLYFEEDEITYKISLVESALLGINDRERYICDKFYLHDWTWAEVSACYNRDMPENKNLRGLKDCRRGLIDKIMRILE